MYWIWLSEIKGIGPGTAKRMLDVFKNPENIYQASKVELEEVPGIGRGLSEVIATSRSLDHAERILEQTKRLNIKVLKITDPLYPEEIKDIPESPTLLYYRGNLREYSMGVGIVGSRRCSNYGKEVTKEAAIFLAKNNIPVISGMAKGVDGYAHTACIKAGGYTITFLGNGLDICYPKEHGELMEKIIATGAVISQYPPKTPAKREHFPKRNFLISLWSKKLLVAEAGQKSGALITAKYSQDLQRQVFAAPNSIYQQEGIGTNRLIADGASIYIDPSQLLIEAPSITNACALQQQGSTSYPTSQQAPTSLEQKILTTLKHETCNMDQLFSMLPEDRKTIIEAISIMELEGKVKILPSGIIVPLFSG
ncbi:DNA processing protein [Desulfitispora alkaliphila]